MIAAEKLHPDSFHAQFLRGLSDTTDGSKGKYRAPANFLLVDAQNDQEAINLYLQKYVTKTEARSTASSLERLAIWSILVQGKAISDLNLADYRAYIELLQNPPPEWISKRQNKKGTPEWRPFTYITRTEYTLKLSKRSYQNCLIIRKFYRWANDCGYVLGNPMSLAMAEMQWPRVNKLPFNLRGKYIGDNVMFDLDLTNQSYPYDPAFKNLYKARTELILSMLYHVDTGLNELSKARMSDFRCVDSAWFFCSNPDHHRSFTLPVGSATFNALMQWRKELGLSDYPDPEERYPLLPAITRYAQPLLNRRGIGIDKINEIIGIILKATSERLVGHQEDLAVRLKSATSKWVRFKGRYDRRDGTYYRHFSG